MANQRWQDKGLNATCRRGPRLPGNALRVCYFGTYRAEYARNRIMIEGLRRNGIQVIECHVPLWRSIEDRVATVNGGWRQPAFWRRVFGAYCRLLWQFWAVRNSFDILVVGYPGQFDVFLARVASWLVRKPLVWDLFMSIYLIAQERGLEQRNRGIMRLLRLAERSACRLPDLMIQDTAEYVQWLHRTHGIPTERFGLVPTGADSERFRPLPPVATTDCFKVLYYGSFIPNHAVMTIMAAARLLKHQPAIEFELVGDGPDREAALAFARQHGLTSVHFRDWMEQEQLVQVIGEADVCLGAFGITPQSMMTVQNKIYECLALAKPLISGDSPTMRRTFVHGRELWFCPRDDPQALADSIVCLQVNPLLRQRLAAAGHACFLENYTIERIGEIFAGHLVALVAQAGVN